MTATVFDISRGSVHDGPGIRTVVYFKGCNLRCRWCHNPEGLSPRPRLRFLSGKCIGCGRCGGLAQDPFREPYSPGLHDAAVADCPTLALTVCGREVTVDALFDEIVKDRSYFRSGGGVTVSGGEPLLQARFIREFFLRCRAEGVHTCVETALFAPRENLEELLDVTDLFIADLKCVDEAQHIAGTGFPNRLILQNHRYLAGRHPAIWVRTPLIPGYTDSPENQAACTAFVRSLGDAVQRQEFLPYNPLYMGKRASIGLPESEIERQEK